MAGGDGVDGTTVSFLSRQALNKKEEEQRTKETLMTRWREVSLELDTLRGALFERRSAQEDARVSELQKALDRVD